MITLLDTNVWVYAYAGKSPFTQKAEDILHQVKAGVFPACTTPQVLLELYAVLTRKDGGLAAPIHPFTAARWIKELARSSKIRVLQPTAQTYWSALRLALSLPVTGSRVHDLFLAATALDNGVGRLCTADERFPQVPDLEVWNPFK